MNGNVVFESYAENAFDIETKEKSITWKREWYNANFKQFFPKDLNSKLLDIGPGLGELLVVESEWGYKNPYAIDISPSTIEFCKRKGLQCEKVEDTAEWLNCHENTYDVITLLDVFEHIPQDQAIAFLAACKKALNHNGILILQVPNIQSAESFLHRYNDITHVFGYSQHTLEQLISIVKFETVKFYPFEEYPGSSEDRKAVRRLRSIYWKFLSTNREITHNLNPQIVTPELFAVLSKSDIQLPDNSIQDEFEDGKISIDDIKRYLEKTGISCELLDEVEKVTELEKKEEHLIKEQEWMQNEISSLKVELKNEISSLKVELQNEISSLRELLQNETSTLKEQIKDTDNWIEHVNDELKNQEKGFYSKLDEQNGRLVKFVDDKINRLDEHNVWTRQRLDNLEKIVDKIRHPFRTNKDKE